MIDRDFFLPYRLFIVRVGLGLSWAGTAGLVWLANRGPGPMAGDAVRYIVALGVVSTLLTVAPWRRALLRDLGDGLIGIWAVVAVGGLVVADDLSPGSPLSVAYILVVLFTAATLVPRNYLVVVAVSAFGGYALALDQAGLDLLEGGTRVGLAAFALAALFAVLASIGVSRVFGEASTRLRRLEGVRRELEERREELDELYAVSATIGLGGTLAEIVPVVLSRLVRSVDARVGLVFLFRPEHDDLELISPLWVAGNTVRAEGYVLPLTDGGIVQRVFTSSDPLVSNEPIPPGGGETLLQDLDITSVAAVPMAVDGRPVGVLVVADKAEGGFTDSDAAHLQSLAGPAALVMNQMARFDAAQEMSQKMSELAQMKADFVSVVSHELRSPITSIIGSLHTLMRPQIEPGSDTARELVATAARQADRLRALIEDLLVASRLDSDALPVRPEPVRIGELISDLLADLATADRVSVQVPEDLPEVEVDPAHLQRIVRNLVENAMKYASESRIEIVVRQSGEQVWLSVVDHGPGIPYELHDHVFQPFTQAQHHQTRAQGGTGLGLSIVRGLAAAMGGRVWYEPTVGGGATFTVALPRRSGARHVTS